MHRYKGRLAQSGRALPYKEEVTGSNPVAPARVFQKSSKKPVHPTKHPHLVKIHKIYGLINYENNINYLFVTFGLWGYFITVNEEPTTTITINMVERQMIDDCEYKKYVGLDKLNQLYNILDKAADQVVT